MRRETNHMADEPREIRQEKVQEKGAETTKLALELDEVVGSGRFAAIEGSPAVRLDKPSNFAISNALQRRPLYKESALKVGGTPLPVSAGDLYIERLKILST